MDGSDNGLSLRKPDTRQYVAASTGVGKTHLAVGLGLKAIEHGYRVLFTTAAQMIATLARALAENRLDERLKTYTVPRLLILDEIGYLPIDRAGANLVFQRILHRYPYCSPSYRFPPTAADGAMSSLAGRSCRCHSHWPRPREVRNAM